MLHFNSRVASLGAVVQSVSVNADSTSKKVIPVSISTHISSLHQDGV